RDQTCREGESDAAQWSRPQGTERMRPLRDPLNSRSASRLLALAITVSVACERSRDEARRTDAGASVEQGRETSARNSYFPLTVGNWWTLRCSSEGEFQFEKTLRVTSDSTVGGTPFFRVEQTTTSDAKPLVFYLFQTTNGIVSKTFVPGRDSAAPLVRSTMSVGDRAGALA